MKTFHIYTKMVLRQKSMVSCKNYSYYYRMHIEIGKGLMLLRTK